MNKIINFTAFFRLTALFLIANFLVACSGVKKDTAQINDELSTDAPPPVVVDVLPRTIPLPHHDQRMATKPKIPKWVARPALSYKRRFAGALESHNKIRAKHNIPPLKWSDKLAKYSQQWANQLGAGNSCKMYHRPGTPPYGENLYRSTAIVWSDGRREISPVTIREVVKAWTNEERWYNYKNNSCQPGRQCGHYTQAVWKETTEVGCAIKVCNDKSQTWVCSYNPAGNYTGLKPY